MASVKGKVVSSSLPTHDLALLRSGDLAERKRLLQTCESYGFFYLDLRSDAKLLDQWQQLLATMAEYFTQPLETKMQDDRKSDNIGYVSMHYESSRSSFDSISDTSRLAHLPGMIL